MVAVRLIRSPYALTISSDNQPFASPVFDSTFFILVWAKADGEILTSRKMSFRGTRRLEDVPTD